jgi:23S rRNA (adenine2503-C2)-methyltransferase
MRKNHHASCHLIEFLWWTFSLWICCRHEVLAWTTISSSNRNININNPRTGLSVASPPILPAEAERPFTSEPHVPISPLSFTLEELGAALEGKGRAQACFDCYRIGVDPLWYFEDNEMNKVEDGDQLGNGWTRQQIQERLSGRRQEHGLGSKALTLLRDNFGTIENIASLSKVSVSNDGTTKLLLKLHADELEVETVIIPWSDRERSTLCISSQIGCQQACTFCMTGRMGKLRNLSSDEILAQMYWASKACRIRGIFPVDNIVFMGMGEPADNAEAVVRCAKRLVDPNIFQLAPRRVTISTVAPSPEAFEVLGESSVVLAWSVHASNDKLRKELVPTTRHTMSELRSGLISTLQKRSKRLRNTMLEITLLDQINDKEDDALHLVEFCKPLLEQVDGIKLVVNLIPWNDIGASFGPASNYRKPSMDRVLAFQKVLVENGILCYVRTTRGDDENAACGMLATKKKRKELDVASKGDK